MLKAGNELSPVFESPLGLFDPDTMADALQEQYNIPRRVLTGVASPWALKRLEEWQGDLERFRVVKLYPSRRKQFAIAKTEPGDDNNQDISALVGKVDIRKLEMHSQSDPDAYGFSGGLNRANQGILEFVEMFKAPIKMLHPLLTATQEGNYLGTESIGAIPFTGIILAHSNEAEWQRLPQQPDQRGVPRPGFGGQGALLPAGHGRSAHLQEADQRVGSGPKRLARRTRWRCWPDSPSSRAPSRTPTPARSPRCGSMTARTSARPIPKSAPCRNTATPPASMRAWTASPPDSPTRCCRPRSTTRPAKSPPTRCMLCMCSNRP